MCGILFRVKHGSEFECPGCIPQLRVESKGQINYNVWSTSETDQIDSFISSAYNLKINPLSEADRRKVENLDVLRGLNARMSKIKNNVKLPKEQIVQQTQDLQNQIDTIVDPTQDGPTPLSKYDIQDLIYKTACRGPNYLEYRQFGYNDCQFQLFSSVLSLRQPFQPQPVHYENKILQFNGELYNEECQETNDTAYIINQLRNSQGKRESVLKVLCNLKGEFAFIFLDLASNLVYFGRDSVGRRSLCYRHEDDELVIASAAEMGSRSFLECKNEISIYDVKTNSIEHLNYADLHDAFKIRCFNYNPLPYDSTAKEKNKLKGLYEILKLATSIRQDSIHPLTHQDASLAILFSGGLDCTVIAALICENIIVKRPSKEIKIDLLTVGFDNPRTNQLSKDSPDRKLSKKSWYNLASKYNGKYLSLRLVEMDITYEKWLIHKERVRDLMFPSNTEMDLSIAIAFYFASSILPGSTTITKLSTVDTVAYDEFILNESLHVQTFQNYSSAAKVLFSGLGADELFAGYSRHESIFTNCITTESSIDNIKGRYEVLSKELVHDINVIHTRNLGRDDRVISCWGKELRYPYLDENVIQYVINRVEPNLKFYYEFESVMTKKKGLITVMKGTRKYLLRELAGLLGLDWVKDELKRAIQFGAKSAKLEVGQSKVKGTDRL